MDEVDTTLLRLADPAARPSLLPSDALLQIAVTAYEVDPAVVVGETTAVYDSVDLQVTIPADVSASARWGRATDPLPAEGHAQLSGLVAPQPGADAVWTGSIVLRTGGGLGTIVAADVSDAGHDIAGDDHVDVGLTFSTPPVITAQSSPVVLPVVVAFVVGSIDSSPRNLLRQRDSARRAAARYPAVAPPAQAPVRTQDRCVCWLLPAAAFDDDGWPGGSTGSAAQKRTARLAAARGWLTRQGIALVTT